MRFKEFSKELTELREIGKGWRGRVYRAEWKGQDIAIKVAKHKEVERAIRKEAEILSILRGMKEFPQLLLSGEDFLAYRFIEGVPLSRAGLSPDEELKVLKKVLEIAYKLDMMGINKDEFTRIDKNVLIDSLHRVYLIDFERGKFSKRPSNLTQYMQFLVRKGVLPREEAIRLGKAYPRNKGEVFRTLLSKLK